MPGAINLTTNLSVEDAFIYFSNVCTNYRRGTGEKYAEREGRVEKTCDIIMKKRKKRKLKPNIAVKTDNSRKGKENLFFLCTIFVNWSIIIIAGCDEGTSSCTPEISSSMVL